MAIGDQLLGAQGSHSAKANGAINVGRVVCNDGVDANGAARVKQGVTPQSATLASVDRPCGIAKATVATTENCEYFAQPGMRVVVQGGGVVAANVDVTFDANGKVVALGVPTATQYAAVVGRSIEACAADLDFFTIEFNPRVLGKN